MGLLDNLERGLEKAVRSAFSAGGSRKVKPVEIANALRIAMDDEVMSISEGRTLVPNIFTLSFSPENFEQVRDWGKALATELCDDAIRHADEQGYTLQGPVRVTFMQNEELSPGNIDVDSATERADPDQQPAPPQSQPQPEPAPQPQRKPQTEPAPERRKAALKPVLEIDGSRFALNSSSVVLGRATDADITLNDQGVSRRHMEIRTSGSTVTAVDLGSTNGFYVNGHKVQGSTELRHGDALTVGRIRILFRMLPENQANQYSGGSR